MNINLHKMVTALIDDKPQEAKQHLSDYFEKVSSGLLNADRVEPEQMVNNQPNED